MSKRMPESILVVDDDAHVREIFSAYLPGEGYEVTSAPDALSALSSIRCSEPDLILLDLRLPDKNGLDTLRAIRESGCAAPVIMLTACSSDTDKIVGLELGADDYITKPFSAREVLARIRTVLRRFSSTDAASARVMSVGPIVVDRDAYEVRVGTSPVPLTRTEFRIVELLARHSGRTFERNQLLDAIDADADVLDRTLDKHIMNIRKKLEPFGDAARSIVTVHGVGYRMIDGTLSMDAAAATGAS